MATDTAVTPVHARATVRPDKAEVVAELTASFRDSTATVLTEYRGLTVQQITDLRSALGTDTTYSVVKNTLTKLAASGAGLAGLDALLAGPTAVAFVRGEPVAAAKALRDYAKANPALVIKGGVLDGKPLTAAEIAKLADLESREVLLAKMAGALKASLSQAVYVLAAPLSQAARLVGALQAKAEADPSVLRGGAGTPVTPAAAAEVTAAPAAETAGEPAPVADTPTDAPADSPAEAVPGSAGPVDAAPVDAAPVDAAPVDAAPVDTSPVAEAPAAPDPDGQPVHHPDDQSAPAGVIAHVDVDGSPDSPTA